MYLIEKLVSGWSEVDHILGKIEFVQRLKVEGVQLQCVELLLLVDLYGSNSIVLKEDVHVLMHRRSSDAVCAAAVLVDFSRSIVF